MQTCTRGFIRGDAVVLASLVVVETKKIDGRREY
jgi:hypothetical protein